MFKIITIFVTTLEWIAGIYCLCAFAQDYESWKQVFGIFAGMGWTIGYILIFIQLHNNKSIL